MVVTFEGDLRDGSMEEDAADVFDSLLGSINLLGRNRSFWTD